MNYRVRLFRESDAPKLAELTSSAIREIGAQQYSAEQVQAWASRHQAPSRFADRVATGAIVFVAAMPDDEPAAYALLESDGHLDMLYCHPDHAGHGLAGRLLAAAQDHAIASGCDRLFTEASELARPAFERAGYAVQHRRDFTIEHEGRDVPIHNYAMEKRLR
ncbi:MAG: GNAT family N-acetyltransferase [Pseudomonadota bacterium]